MDRQSELLAGWINWRSDCKYEPLLTKAKGISAASNGRKLWTCAVPRLVYIEIETIGIGEV